MLPVPHATSSLLRTVFAKWIWPLRFGLILALPLPLFDAIRFKSSSDLFTFYPLFVIFFVITGADYIIGKDKSQPAPDARKITLYKWISVAALPIQFATLLWAGYMFASMDLSWIGKLGWILSVGAVSGILAITAAHELIHRPTRLEQWAGGLLLSSVCYGGFKIEHIYGHHVNVATPKDASSARYGQSVYAFVPRSAWNNIKNAWLLDAIQLQRRGLPVWRSELLVWSLLSLMIAVAAWCLFGEMGLLFFLAQSVVAFFELEMINYIEHYGLARRPTEHGYERVAPAHSWNSSYRLTNWFLLNLQRHSDHHAHASRRYQELRHFDEAPELPGGYSAMILLSLIPPLWFRIIHPRIPACGETLPQTAGFPSPRIKSSDHQKIG